MADKTRVIRLQISAKREMTFMLITGYICESTFGYGETI
jgi:hypothetical protein